MIYLTYAGLMLGQRRRRWTNGNPAYGQFISAGEFANFPMFIYSDNCTTELKIG